MLGREIYMVLKFKNPNTLLRIGLFSFLFANGWHWFVRPGAYLSDGFVDLIHGLFIGIAIATMLLSIALRGGQSRCSQDQS